MAIGGWDSSSSSSGGRIVPTVSQSVRPAARRNERRAVLGVGEEKSEKLLLQPILSFWPFIAQSACHLQSQSPVPHSYP